MNIGTAVTLGDEGQHIGTVMIGSDETETVEVNVYESLSEPGRIVIDVIAENPDVVIVTLNDGDLHRVEHTS